MSGPTPETWGESLRRHIARSGNDLKHLVDFIQKQTEFPRLGVRNSFAALLSADEIPTNATQRFRAYLLLVAIGQDPAAWGLTDADLPALIDAKTVRRLLK